ncbi:hypothetical protein DRN79_01350 [Methanosarcinales archaeon]|nr:MAG: hypothetical protein DRN79_01350 [Methanosarcinales archaeon]
MVFASFVRASFVRHSDMKNKIEKYLKTLFFLLYVLGMEVEIVNLQAQLKPHARHSEMHCVN